MCLQDLRFPWPQGQRWKFSVGGGGLHTRVGADSQELENKSNVRALRGLRSMRFDRCVVCQTGVWRGEERPQRGEKGALRFVSVSVDTDQDLTLFVTFQMSPLSPLPQSGSSTKTVFFRLTAHTRTFVLRSLQNLKTHIPAPLRSVLATVL